ncbi:MAG: hypothetical protein QUS08_08720 [Methanothrix sp.]|nr:hypothetical protein [Methanothrix sp.]
MGIRSVVAVLALLVCISATASAQGPKNTIVEPPFPGENMSGAEIYQEVRGGVYADPNDSSLSFRNESLFIIREDTGMSPHVPDEGVRTPVQVVGAMPAAGVWYFTLQDVSTSYMRLSLSQAGDAVFGSGEVTSSGAAVRVNAGGTVLGDRLALFVIPEGSQKIYRMSLTIGPGSMNGNYLFTAPGLTQPGVAFGRLMATTGLQAV